MILQRHDLQVTSATEVGHGEWNDLRNKFNLRTIAESIKFPESLVTAAMRDFNDWAQRFHMDASAFRFVEVTLQDPCWQVDFCTKDREAVVSVHEIYFSTKRRSIMQRCIRTQ